MVRAMRPRGDKGRSIRNVALALNLISETCVDPKFEAIRLRVLEIRRWIAKDEGAHMQVLEQSLRAVGLGTSRPTCPINLLVESIGILGWHLRWDGFLMRGEGEKYTSLRATWKNCRHTYSGIVERQHGRRQERGVGNCKDQGSSTSKSPRQYTRNYL